MPVNGINYLLHLRNENVDFSHAPLETVHICVVAGKKELTDRRMATEERNNLREPGDYVSSGQILENVLLVWLDANIDEKKSDSQKTLKQLRAIVNDVILFKEVDPCVQFLNGVLKEKALVITSGSLGQELVQQIHSMKQVDAIFVFCGNKARHESWAAEWSKIRGVYERITPICKGLEEAVRQSNHDLTPMSIVDKTESQGSNTNVNELDPSFMYTQLFKRILLQMKHDENDRRALMKRCRTNYGDNQDYLKVIDEFSEKYEAEDAITWYTRDCFLYKMLNRALRLLECDIIVDMGFFIHDLHRRLERLHHKQYDQYEGPPLTLYRGQGLSKEEFIKLKESPGGLLSFNGFLSTSHAEEVSREFVKTALKNINQIVVLFVITVDPKIPETVFADIRDESFYTKEVEILFSMHTVFRIGEVDAMDDSGRLFRVQLTLTGDDDAELRCLTNKIDQEITGDTGRERLGDLLVQLERLDKAEELYRKLLDEEPTEREKATCYHYMGMIKDKQREYDESIRYYKDAIAIKEKILAPTDPILASSYNNLGMVYSKMGEYEKALSYYKKDLEICEKTLPVDHRDLATSYNNMGDVYENMGDYAKALSYYEKDLAICQRTLPPSHPDIATSYNNIGSLYGKKKEYSKALDYYERALKIRKKSLPPNHTEIAASYNNIAWLHRSKKDFKQALDYYERALTVWEQTLPQTHHNIVDVRKSIELVKAKM